MNKYGTRAAEYWRTFRPAEYAAIADPVGFFGPIGEQMAAQINALALSLAGDDPTGEGYLAKVGRLRMARLQAEEQVVRETLPLSDPDDRAA
jgi:hypothetical protein